MLVALSEHLKLLIRRGGSVGAGRFGHFLPVAAAAAVAVAVNVEAHGIARPLKAFSGILPRRRLVHLGAGLVPDRVEGLEGREGGDRIGDEICAPGANVARSLEEGNLAGVLLAAVVAVLVLAELAAVEDESNVLKVVVCVLCVGLCVGLEFIYFGNGKLNFYSHLRAAAGAEPSGIHLANNIVEPHVRPGCPGTVKDPAGRINDPLEKQPIENVQHLARVVVNFLPVRGVVHSVTQHVPHVTRELELALIDEVAQVLPDLPHVKGKLHEVLVVGQLCKVKLVEEARAFRNRAYPVKHGDAPGELRGGIRNNPPRKYLERSRPSGRWSLLLGE